MIDQAFIMAAGMGKRMQPLSLDRPKPMVEVMGRPIIDHILDHLRRVGVFHVVINLYHCGDVLRDHLHDVGDMQIAFSEEDTLLDTGGGLQQGLRYMSDPTRPFYAINGDAFWQEQETLPQLQAAWNDQAMNILLLLQETARMKLAQGVGDYKFANPNQPVRCPDRDGTHMFTGIRIMHPRVLNRCVGEAFSFLEMMDTAQEKGRLYGLDNPGMWHHLSTPQDIKVVEEALG